MSFGGIFSISRPFFTVLSILWLTSRLCCFLLSDRGAITTNILMHDGKLIIIFLLVSRRGFSHGSEGMMNHGFCFNSCLAVPTVWEGKQQCFWGGNELWIVGLKEQYFIFMSLYGGGKWIFEDIFEQMRLFAQSWKEFRRCTCFHKPFDVLFKTIYQRISILLSNLKAFLWTFIGLLKAVLNVFVLFLRWIAKNLNNVGEVFEFFNIFLGVFGNSFVFVYRERDAKYVGK